MRLIRLRLTNFRQFYGETDIHFGSGEKNVTVIHGENGAGKTAMLNAFKWVLYGQVTTGVQLREQVVTKRAIYEASAGDRVEASVELEFEHNERKYVVKRQVESVVGARPSESKTSEPEVTLRVCDTSGEWRNIDQVQDAIGRVLPPDLHTYFFFDGERIDQIVRLDQREQEQIANASKKLLGVEVLERADNHLDKARRELEKELRDVGDDVTKLLIDEKSGLEAEIDAQENEIDRIKRELSSLGQQREEIEDRLRRLEDVKSLQDRRDELKKEHERRESSLNDHKQHIKDLLSKSAHAVFLEPSINKFNDLCTELSNRGELPAGIKKQFVSELLNKNVCICGAELTPGSSHRKSVEGWLERAGLVDVEEMALRIGGAITQMSEERPRFLDNLDRLQKARHSDSERVADIERELDDISDQLKTSPREEVAKLENRRTLINEQWGRLKMDQGAAAAKVSEKRTRIEAIDEERGRIESTVEGQRRAQRRVSATIDARNRIMEVRRTMEEDFRSQLQDRISNLFQKISPTPYVVRMEEDYSLHLYDSVAESAMPADASTGERQILSLAFIGSIIDVTRQFKKASDDMPGQESTQLPIVMDSPFGALSMYRSAIADNMPRLADQVVLMVSPKQWEGDVMRAMSGRVGRQYVLSYATPKEGVAAVTATISGEKHHLVEPSTNGYEYTEVREVTHG